MRKLLIILDGAADRGDKTSLAVAKTPALDYFARNSLCGMMYPIKGIAPESGAAQFTILGYNLKDYSKRGPVETLSKNIRLKKGEIALRINFATIKGNKIINYRTKIPSKKVLDKINKIDKDIKVIPTIDYRGVIIVKNASPNITNTHPGYKRKGNISTAIIPIMKLKKCKGDKKTAKKINNFLKEVQKILKNRTIVIRGAGSRVKKFKKLKGWSLVADAPVEIGLARMFGMNILKRSKNEIKQIVKRRDNVYVQIKAPDFYAHRKDFKSKVKALERVDKMLKPLLKLKNIIICITADHATPWQVGVHTSDPVPFLIYGKKRVRPVKKFSEKECKKTKIKIQGKDLMKLIYSQT